MNPRFIFFSRFLSIFFSFVKNNQIYRVIDFMVVIVYHSLEAEERRKKKRKDVLNEINKINTTTHSHTHLATMFLNT